MPTALVTGGTGMVGRALIARLVDDGAEVLATARSRAAAADVEALGARPLYTDVANLGGWREEASAAEAVWHLGLPRVVPPVRRRAAARMGRRAGDAATALAELLDGRPVVLASSGFVYGDRTTPAPADAPLAPIALGAPALAAERALAASGARIVRLPWVYGRGGILRAMVLGLKMRRFRMVGSGANRWSLLAVEDAVEALVAAAGRAPGATNACEDDAPTLAELIGVVCAAPDVRRPDTVPRGMAAFSLGGAMAEALAVSTWLAPDGDGPPPAATWRQRIPELVADPELIRGP